MVYRVKHRTVYAYTSPASLSYNELCLRLRAVPHQRILDQTIHWDPRPDTLRERQDVFGNPWISAAWERPLTQLTLDFSHEVEVSDPWNGVLPEGPSVTQALACPHSPDTAPFYWTSTFVRRDEPFAAYARDLFPPGASLIEAVLALTLRIRQDFTYSPAATTISTPVEEVLRTRKGVCQDFAHLQLSMLRSLGLTCRYVSGYLHTEPPPGHEKIRGADASHAWISVACPGVGWVDFDPTNGLLVRDGHVTLAWGRDYADVAPLKGVVLGGGGQTLTVEVDVNATPPR